jgi:hypothetical protein
MHLMKLQSWLTGVLLALWIAGCTESNPYYVPPDAEDVPGDGLGDVPPGDDGTGDADTPREDAGETPPDVPPDVPPDTTDVPVDSPVDSPVDVPVDVPPDVPPDAPPDVVLCGNGAVDPGEECDDTSAFCVDCDLAPPADWVECTDAAGHPVFFLVDGWPGNHSADDWRDRCRTTVEGLSPVGYEAYGLAAFYDQALWDCIVGALDTDSEYWIGSRQNREASDYAEPDGGWYWNAWDGTAWTDLAPLDPAAAWLGGAFDGTGGWGDADCARLQSDGTTWTMMDYSCTSDARIEGICMVRY